METCLVNTNILLATGWLDPGYWWGVAQVIMGLGFVIFVHELGHFLVAKACGVKCEKFYVGFDFFDIKIGDRIIIPRSLVKWQWGETEYGVGIVPLGGYVKMLGQDDNPANRDEEIARSRADDSTSDEDLYEPSGLVDRTKLDPRSFLAKSVPQRMAIISAGVVFNILFAILLGAIAFRSGVNYEPAMIGGVTAGGPAWEANMTESQVLRVGEQRFDEGYATFIHMAEAIIFDGSEEDAVLEIEYIPKGEMVSKTAKISPRQIGAVDFPRIGVSPMRTLTLADKNPTLEGRSANTAETPFMAGDTIVKANGNDVDSMLSLQTELVKSYGKDITVVVQRKVDPKDKNAEPETVEITISPDRMRTFGITCKWSPIARIRMESPAAKAGFEIGDEIVSINGKEPSNLYALDLDVIKHVRENPDQPMVFVIKREGSEKTIELDAQLPLRTTLISQAEPVGIESLGLAIPTSNIVSNVAPDSPADKAGIKVGDELTGTQAVLTDEQKSDETYARAGRERPYEKGEINFSDTHGAVQQFPVGQEFNISYKRGEESKTATMKSVASDEYYLTTLGVHLTPFQEVYTADSWGEAFKLGAKQTWVDLTKVFKFLGKLVRGRISAKNLGGPGTIFVVAQSEASQGTSRLMLFLVLLSANLAIINFLPIPVLDGGHMMFLAYEGLFRKPVTEKVQVLLTYVGFLALLALMAFVIWQDVGRIAKLF